MSSGDLNEFVELEEEVALRGGDDDSMGDELCIEDVEAPSEILIPPRFLSSADIARRGSEPRILLDQADLKLAHQVDTEVEQLIGMKHELSFSSLHKEEITRKKKDDFVLNDGTGLSSSHAQSLLEQYGYNVLPEERTPKWFIFLQQLWQPMPLAIWVAIIILAAIQLFIDMGILLFIQFANAR